MFMRRHSIRQALAAALLACGLGATEVRAGFVTVNQDGGTFNFALTSTGNGSFSISYTAALLTSINGVNIPTGGISDMASLPSETSTVTSVASVGALTYYTLTQPVPFQKTFGAGAGAVQEATLAYNITSGISVNPGFLNLSGFEVASTMNLLQTTATGSTIYDFSSFNQGGTITRTFTSVGGDFSAVIKNGGTIVGTGAFSDLPAVVPEPSSITLAMIGLLGLVAFRGPLLRLSRS
jgi:hypothetical protein